MTECVEARGPPIECHLYCFAGAYWQVERFDDFEPWLTAAELMPSFRVPLRDEC